MWWGTIGGLCVHSNGRLWDGPFSQFSSARVVGGMLRPTRAIQSMWVQSLKKGPLCLLLPVSHGYGVSVVIVWCPRWKSTASIERVHWFMPNAVIDDLFLTQTSHGAGTSGVIVAFHMPGPTSDQTIRYLFPIQDTSQNISTSETIAFKLWLSLCIQ